MSIFSFFLFLDAVSPKPHFMNNKLVNSLNNVLVLENFPLFCASHGS